MHIKHLKLILIKIHILAIFNLSRESKSSSTLVLVDDIAAQNQSLVHLFIDFRSQQGLKQVRTEPSILSTDLEATMEIGKTNKP